MQLFFLLLFVLLDQVAMVTTVSGCQDAKDKDDRPSKNCKAAGLSDVPAGFDPKTKVLLFPNNLFSSLSWSSFQLFTEIYEIDLAGNKIPDLTPSDSPLLPTLSVLRLGLNRLTSLSDHSFSACPDLTELWLNNNTIQSLSDQTFSGLSKLQILDLSSNHIKVLPGSMLHPFSAIEFLYIYDNKIRVMPDGWFSKQGEVPYLFLTDNPWDCTCSNLYLQIYILEFDTNFYIRDGPNIRDGSFKVECASPPRHAGTPVMDLEQTYLCPPEGHLRGDVLPPSDPVTQTVTTFIPAVSSPPPTPAAPVLLEEELSTVSTRVVTLSWYQTFTSLIEWSESVVRSEMTLVGLDAVTTGPTRFTVTPTTESPGSVETTWQTTPAETTESFPSTVTSTTLQEKVRVTTTFMTPATTHSTPSRAEVGAVRSAGLFCCWLFAGCLLLCVVSAGCILVTVWRLIVWYRRVYKPLTVTLARKGESEGLRLLTCNRREEEVGGGGGMMSLYRSVLYVNREEGEAMEGEDRAEEGEAGKVEPLLVTLKPTGGGATREEEDERGVYRKTLYRQVRKEEAIEGWRDVVEECRVSAEDGGRRGGAQCEGVSRGTIGGVSRKYSVILREEREEAAGRREELDWVVGGWEVKRGGEEPRSSWGEWLEHYLPRLPWGVTTPTKEEVAE
uniref:Platelet glycoprotein Ib alpha chain-like n=1 Tax=Labrus bergylta TaxID=56723 RepID=A0A3Q3GGC9_9LABR|nr:platelet glycoprotein Ib alpha chain-like [Labrus bergylta]